VSNTKASNLIVHHLAGAWGLPSVSPFCLKLDAYLRLAGIDHQTVIDATPFGAPKGKAPWIEHDGKKIGDSSFIIDYLRERFSVDPDAGLTQAERGAARALKRMLEENLYWTMVYDRWLVEPNWKIFREIVLGGVSPPMRRIIGPLARRNVKKQLRGHGIGLHSADEIHAIGIGDAGALADYLGDKPFLMGANPTEIDTVAYGLLANIMVPPIASPVKDDLLNRRKMVDYIARFRTRFYG
jgi:glutathione S-transferase